MKTEQSYKLDPTSNKEHLQLKCSNIHNIPQSSEGEIFCDDKILLDIIKFAYSVLTRSVAEKTLKEIHPCGGSKPKFIILLNMFLKHIGEKKRVLTASQVWDNAFLFQNNFWVDAGLYLNGICTHEAESKFLVKQFNKLNKDLAVVDKNSGWISIPIKIDLRGLVLDRTGLIQITEESIWTETNAIEKGEYLFQEINGFGVPLKNRFGFVSCSPARKGLFRCRFRRDLGFDPCFTNFDFSNIDYTKILIEI